MGWWAELLFKGLGWWVGLFSKDWVGGLVGGAVVQRVGLVGRAVFKRLDGWDGEWSCCSNGWVGGLWMEMFKGVGGWVGGWMGCSNG